MLVGVSGASGVSFMKLQEMMSDRIIGSMSTSSRASAFISKLNFAMRGWRFNIDLANLKVEARGGDGVASVKVFTSSADGDNNTMERVRTMCHSCGIKLEEIDLSKHPDRRGEMQVASDVLPQIYTDGDRLCESIEEFEQMVDNGGMDNGVDAEHGKSAVGMLRGAAIAAGVPIENGQGFTAAQWAHVLQVGMSLGPGLTVACIRCSTKPRSCLCHMKRARSSRYWPRGAVSSLPAVTLHCALERIQGKSHHERQMNSKPRMG